MPPTLGAKGNPRIIQYNVSEDGCVGLSESLACCGHRPSTRRVRALTRLLSSTIFVCCVGQNCAEVPIPPTSLPPDEQVLDDVTRPPDPGPTPTPAPTPTPTPPPPDDESGWDEDYYLKQGDRTRSYRVHYPTDYHDSIEWPVVVVFHGGGGNVTAQAAITRLNDLADREGLVCVWPRGTGDPPYQQFYWNPGDGPNGPFFDDPELAGIDDISFVEMVLDDLEQRVTVDPKRIFATGFSNGAILLHELTCRLSDRLAAVAPVAGPFWGFEEACLPSRPVPMLYFHGTQDYCIPYDGGQGYCSAQETKREFLSVAETIEIWRDNNGCSPSGHISYEVGNVTCITYDNNSSAGEITSCTIIDGGHVWPGGMQYNEATGEFDLEDDADLDASEAIWAFFQDHPMP